jgi:thiol-disulfide isomerase/thioredoxin
MGCLAAKPIVNGIEKDLEGRARVLRLNVLGKIGRELAGRYDVRGLPTVVAIDGAGKVVYRHTGLPDRQRIVRELAR